MESVMDQDNPGLKSKIRWAKIEIGLKVSEHP